MNTYISLLKRNKDFRSLWLASVVTMLGDWFNTIGTIVLINQYTDSGLAVAGLFLARMLPPFLLGPIAGLVADRLPRKLILIVSDLLRVLIVLGFLVVDSASEAWLVYALTALQFVVSTFYNPAHNAIMPNLLKDKDDLLAANTLGSVSWSAMLALGAALGGATAALFGVYTALLIDAMTFAFSALLISRIRTILPAPAKEVSDSNKIWSLLEGVRYAIDHPKIGMVTLVKAMGHIGSINVIMSVYASSLFVYGEDSSLSLGLMMTASGIGAVLGPLLANRFTPQNDHALRRSISIGFVASIVGWILIGSSGLFVLVLAAMLLRSMGSSTNWTYSSVLLQMNVPNRILGRMFALDETIRTLVASLSIWLTGYALDSLNISSQTLSAWFGLIMLVPLALWWFMHRDVDMPVTKTQEHYLATSLN